METHEKISEIQRRAARFKGGDQNLALILLRIDLPFLLKLVESMNMTMDDLCQANDRLKMENARLRNLRIRAPIEEMVYAGNSA